jgi:transcriptional regulator with XRE-family HTH domain
MNYEYQDIGKALKSARESRGLSQRALSEKSGVLQTRISKIEGGAADFRLSTLMALARALDLELALVPRKAISAVQSVARASEPAAASGAAAAEVRKEFERLRQTIAHLPDAAKLTTEYAQLLRHLRDLQHLPIAHEQLDQLRKLRKTFQDAGDEKGWWPAVLGAVQQLQTVRNAAAHVSSAGPRLSPVRPAYTLDDEDDHG